jgi:hypothetical protein
VTSERPTNIRAKGSPDWITVREDVDEVSALRERYADSGGSFCVTTEDGERVLIKAADILDIWG